MNAISSALVLIAEDERDLSDIFQAFFEREGFRATVAADGNTALDLHQILAPDLIVLDIKLPGRDGVEVLAEIRRRGDTPVIMSTALGQDLEKLSALKIGADDYLVKPFNPLELVARAKAILRRARGRHGQNHIVRLANLEIDLFAHEVRNTTGTTIDLTPTEFRLLAHMARAPRKAFTRSELLDACLPQDGNALERTVDSHISNLRTKLNDAGAPNLLGGVRSIGYRLAAS